MRKLKIRATFDDVDGTEKELVVYEAHIMHFPPELSDAELDDVRRELAQQIGVGVDQVIIREREERIKREEIRAREK